MTEIELRISPPLTNEALNVLFRAAWNTHARTDFAPILARSLAWCAAFAGANLVGFVNLAWDGGVHAFLLDTTVHPNVQRQGVGRQLIIHALQVARERGIVWVHVDYESHLEDFYRSCGFVPTLAGLVNLERGE